MEGEDEYTSTLSIKSRQIEEGKEGGHDVKQFVAEAVQHILNHGWIYLSAHLERIKNSRTSHHVVRNLVPTYSSEGCHANYTFGHGQGTVRRRDGKKIPVLEFLFSFPAGSTSITTTSINMYFR